MQSPDDRFRCFASRLKHVILTYQYYGKSIYVNLFLVDKEL